MLSGGTIQMPFWRTDAELSAAWARGRLHCAAAAAEGSSGRVLADCFHSRGAAYNAWFYTTRCLQSSRRGTLGKSRPLSRIDGGHCSRAPAGNSL